MKKFSKILIFVLAASMCLSGCGNSEKDKKASLGTIIEDENVTAPGELPIVKEKIRLSLAIGSTNAVQDYKTNAYTKWIEEKTGIGIDFNVMVNLQQKIKVMLAAGDKLPDMVFGAGIGDDLLIKYGVSGTNTFIDLGGYMDKYGYWLNDMMDKTIAENPKKQLYTSDDARYGMPALIEQTGNMYPQKAWINKTWLDNLGLEMPTTTEEFEKVLTAFKTQDPNGNGKADELGVTGYGDGWCSIPYHFLMNSFIYDDDVKNVVITDDNKVKSIWFDPEYKAGLEYLNGLYKKGLYDDQSFTQGKAELQAIMNMKDNIVGVITGGDADSIFDSKPERMAEYTPLPPLKGPKGIAWAGRGSMTITKVGFVTKYCEHPLAAFRLMDYMLSSESSIFTRFGVEGKDWKKAGENDIAMFGDSLGAKATIVSILPFGQPQNSNWCLGTPYFIDAETVDGMAWNGDPYNGEKFKADALKAYIGKGPKKVFDTASYTLDEMEELSFIEAQIKQHAQQEIPKFILGRRSLDEYDKFLEELNKMDMERYIKLLQSGYDRMHK